MKRAKSCALLIIQSIFGSIFSGCDQGMGTETTGTKGIDIAMDIDDILTPESHQVSTNELYQMALNAFYQYVLYY